MQVLARETGNSASDAPIPVTAGDMLGSDHEVQIRIRVERDTYLYVVAYSSGSQSALLLHPVSGQAQDALLRAQQERIVPGPDRYLALRRQAGQESFFALATSTPPDSLAGLLVRMETAGDDLAVLRSLAAEKFPDLTVVTFQNAGEQSRLAFRDENSHRQVIDPQLDVEAMECLYAWLIGRDTGDTSISPQATLKAPQSESANAAPIGCAGAVTVPLTAELAPEISDPAAAESGGVASGDTPVSAVSGGSPPAAPVELASVADGPRPALPSQSEEASRESMGAVEVEADTLSVAQAPLLAPPKGDLLVALASDAEVDAPLRSIDVTADGNVSSAVVLVVTPAATGTGVLLDYAGHVLANWHVVRGYPSVSVTFKTQAGAAPSRARTRSATVVRVSKTSDLALLRIQNPPQGITPVRLAKTNEIRNGDVVHAVGHPGNRDWAYTLGKIEQVKPGSSWYAGHNLLHRGTVIFAELPDDPGGAGAPLFNNRLELVGIGAMPRSVRGVLTGVSVETIRRFLRAPPARARASASG